jgi:sugar O-acyltransferase (sialic acid O-acetyltransferase NeuD family)
MQPILLGFDPHNIPIITEIYADVYKIFQFRIAKNIEVDKPDVAYQPKGFEFDIRMHGYFDYSEPCHFLFGVTTPHVKWKVFQFFAQNYGVDLTKYLTLSHPDNKISVSAQLFEGVFIEPGVVVASFAEIGFGVTLKRSSSVGHHSRIGNFSTINPGVVINGKVEIGFGTTIGSGAIILDHIQVGSNCMIGAGSIVTRDIPDGMVAYGNPCKVIRENDKWRIPSLNQ